MQSNRDGNCRRVQHEVQPGKERATTGRRARGQWAARTAAENPTHRRTARADIHIATGGAAALNRMRSTGNPVRISRAEIAMLSIATSTVPAAGPKTTALVSVNTSEIEKLAVTVGILSTAEPLISVSATSSHHSTGGRLVEISAIERARTTHPASNTISTYGRARELAARRKLESDCVRERRVPKRATVRTRFRLRFLLQFPCVFRSRTSDVCQAGTRNRAALDQELVTANSSATYISCAPGSRFAKG